MGVQIISASGTQYGAIVNPDGSLKIAGAVTSYLVPSYYDYISLGSYNGADVGTVQFKSGGSAGTLVSTLNLAYVSGNLVSVTKV